MTTAELIEAEPELASPPSRLARRHSAAVSQLHRAIALLALISLFAGTMNSWTALIWPKPGWAAVIMVGYGVMLVLAVCALTVRRRAWMVGVDIGVLLVTFAMRIPEYLASMPAAYPNDEGSLVDMGGGALSHGLDPYNVIWSAPLTHSMRGITETMAGGVVTTYDYPPLPAIFDYLLRPLSGGVPAAAVAAMVALTLATVVLFVILPTPWRSAAPMLLLGLDLMPALARNGYPMIMMTPFLFVAVAGWARIGRTGGRLGARGWTGAICLGLAAGVQPLAWFIAPFLMVGLLVLRLGDLSKARAVWLTTRYAVVVAAVFLAINLPFVFADAGSWWRGTMLPLTDSSVPHGQGLIDISYYLVGGSGNLSGYSDAAIALLIGLLIATALFLRTIGPAVVVLPWITFYLALRSQDYYFMVTAPLWIISAATLRPGDFVNAWQPWPRSRRRVMQVVTFAALLVPAALFVTSAATAPQPLRMTVMSMTTSKVKGNVHAMTVQVTNVSGSTITPHFALSSDESMSRFLVQTAGPSSLAPGATATYALVPWQTSTRSIHGRLLLRATSVDPLTLSSVPVPGSAG